MLEQVLEDDRDEVLLPEAVVPVDEVPALVVPDALERIPEILVVSQVVAVVPSPLVEDSQ